MLRQVMTAILIPSAGIVGFKMMQSNGEVYALPPGKVYTELRTMEFEPGLRQMLAGSSQLDLIVGGEQDKTVTWTLKNEGKAVGELRADLAPSGKEQTRVNVSFKLAEEGALKEHAKFINQQELVSAMIRINVQERLASEIEGREFDDSKVSKAIAHYAVTNPQAMMKFGWDMTRMQHDPRLNGHDLQTVAVERRESYLENLQKNAPVVSPEARQREMEASMAAASAPMMDPNRPRLP